MKKIMVFVIVCALMTFVPAGNFAGPYSSPMTKADEVAIYHGGVVIPLDRILLVRKDDRYCALKFTRVWTEVDEERMKEYAPDIAKGGDSADHFREIATRKYALYESYFQKGCAGDFSSNSLEIRYGKASWLPLRGPFRPFIYQPGEAYVKCCSFKLVWSYQTGVSFIPSGKYLGDYGIELAPTPWTNIKEVNVWDSRINWYRYDEKRERVFIPIDELWEDKK
jgi:hypothetical protein